MRRVLAIVAALALVGCGGDSTGTGDGGGGDGQGGADAGIDASEVLPRQGGLVTLNLNPSLGFTTMTAGFWKTSAAGTGCSRHFEGPCNVTVCSDVATSGLYPVAAGEITATGPGGAMLTIMPMGDGTYSSATESGTGADAPMSGFPPGGTISVSAAGQDVGAFDEEVVMSEAVAVTEPPSSTGVTVDRTLPFTFRWTPGNGDVYVYLDAGGLGFYPITVGTTIRCVLPSSAGEVVIPVSMVEQLPAGMGSMAVTGYGSTYSMVGDFEVQVRAIAYEFVGQITVQ